MREWFRTGLGVVGEQPSSGRDEWEWAEVCREV